MRFAVRGDLLVGEHLERLPDAYLVIESGRITAISPASDPPDVESVGDFSGCTILPGLIDTHCHLCLPGDGRDVERFLKTCGSELAVAVAARNAGIALAGGITTVRDLGSPGSVAFLLRRGVELGLFPSARIVLAGPVLTQTGGHGNLFGMEADSQDDLRKRVRTLCRDGADVIKVMASGGSTPGTSRWRPSYDVGAMKTMAVEAHGRGKAITAHASCPASIERALLAGFDGVEHGNFWIDEDLTVDFRPELAAGLAEQGVFLAPTLQTSYRILEAPGILTRQEARRRREIHEDAMEVFARLLRYEIPFVTGSDAGFLLTGFDELWLGLDLMVQCGMAPLDAIKSATVRAADAVGLGESVGRLAPGYLADLLVVDGDPLSDVRVLRDVREVFLGGEAIRQTGSRGRSFGAGDVRSSTPSG